MDDLVFVSPNGGRRVATIFGGPDMRVGLQNETVRNLTHAQNIFTPQLIYSNIQKISVGGQHNLLIDANHDLIVFGGVRYNLKMGDEQRMIIQAFFKDQNIKICDVECGGNHRNVYYRIQ